MRNHFSPQGITELAACLKQNQTLTDIDLSYDLLTDSDILTLAPAMEIHPKLKVLNLRNNPIGDVGAQALTRVYSRCSLNRLDLIQNAISNEGLLAFNDFLNQYSQNVYIHLSGQWTEIPLETVMILQKTLSNRKLQGHSDSFFIQPYYVSYHVSPNLNSTFLCLSEMQIIEQMDKDRNEHKERAKYAQIISNQLESLEAHIYEPGFTYIADALRIARRNFATQLKIKELMLQCGICSLNSYPGFEAFLEEVKQTKSIESLHLNAYFLREGISSLMRMLKQQEHITKLKIEVTVNYELTYNFLLQQITELLKTNKTLQEITLNVRLVNNLNDEVVEQLIEAIQENHPNLKVFTFSANDVEAFVSPQQLLLINSALQQPFQNIRRKTVPEAALPQAPNNQLPSLSTVIVDGNSTVNEPSSVKADSNKKEPISVDKKSNFAEKLQMFQAKERNVIVNKREIVKTEQVEEKASFSEKMNYFESLNKNQM